MDLEVLVFLLLFISPPTSSFLIPTTTSCSLLKRTPQHHNQHEPSSNARSFQQHLLTTTPTKRKDANIHSFSSKTRVALSTSPDPEKVDDTPPPLLLLRMNLSIKNGTDITTASQKVKNYVRSFPFAATLPVQPLTYVWDDETGAVDIKFLRKKTKEKGSIDGGIRFEIDVENDDDDDVESKKKKIVISAIRNSEGQTVTKIFSEKIIIQSFVKGVNGERGVDLLDVVAIESIFHPWL